MVAAIKNSVTFLGISRILSVLSAKVIECPRVNAVMSINNFFQSLNKYLKQSAVTNRI